jgi:hypothetical protein
MGQWEEMREKGTAKLYMGRSVWSGKRSICPACIVHYHGATYIRHSMFIISSSVHTEMEMREDLSASYVINRQLPAAYSSSIMVIHGCL